MPRPLPGALPSIPAFDGSRPLAEAIEQFEQVYIPHVLKINKGHKGKTAETLNIDRKTLYRKLKKFKQT